MSDYWDALHRAASGVPRTAEPSRHAAFEPDAFAAADEGFEAIDEEIEALRPPPSPQATARLTPQPPWEPALASSSRPTAALGDRGAPPAGPAEVSVTAERPGPEQVPPSQTPAVGPMGVSPALSSEGEGARREPPPAIQRIETLRTMLEAEAPPAANVQAPAATSDPAPIASSAEPGVFAMVGVEVARAPFTEAEPVQRPASEPFAPTASAPAPLVIEIDRIEVRIVSEPASPPLVSRHREPAQGAPNLADYLARRSGVGT